VPSLLTSASNLRETRREALGGKAGAGRLPSAHPPSLMQARGRTCDGRTPAPSHPLSHDRRARAALRGGLDGKPSVVHKGGKKYSNPA